MRDDFACEDVNKNPAYFSKDDFLVLSIQIDD